MDRAKTSGECCLCRIPIPLAMNQQLIMLPYVSVKTQHQVTRQTRKLTDNSFKATNFTCLKGECHEILDLRFFHQTIHPGTLIHGLKPFLILLQDMIFERKNRARRVNDTACTKICCYCR
jgi:hypothetical protein